MGFPQKTVDEVRENFRKRLFENSNKRNKNLNLIYDISPRIKEIDEELQKTGYEILRVALEGKEGLNERLNVVKEKNEALQKEREEILVSLGYDKAFTDLEYECPICQDYGYVNGKMCSCYKKALIKGSYSEAGISKLIEKQSFETFDLNYYTGEARNYAERNWLNLMLYAKEFEENKGNILLIGGTGVGKTHLSTSVAKVLVENGYYVIYETAQNIFTDFENDRFRDRFSGEEPKSQKYFKCDLLIIDDLGSEIPSVYNEAYLYNIINTRLNASLPIIASTNLKSDEMRKMYRDRITSRLFGEFKIMNFFGNDIRRLKMQ